MKKALCIIGMILFFVPMAIGCILAAPYVMINVTYGDEVRK